MATHQPRAALAAVLIAALAGCTPQPPSAPRPGEDANHPAPAAPAAPAADKPAGKPAADPPKADPKSPAADKPQDDPLVPAFGGRDSKKLSAWVAQLDSANSTERFTAATALGNLPFGEKPPDAATQALAKALRDADEGVRLAAVQSLAHYRRFAVPAFTEALKAEDATVRKEAAGALGGLGWTEADTNVAWSDPADAAVAALGDVLMTDKDKEVREAAAKALRAVGERAMPSLLKALKEGDKDARRSAVRALARTPASYGADSRPNYGPDAARYVVPAVPILAGLLTEEDVTLRSDVCKTLASLGDQAGEAIPVLLKLSKAQDSSGVAATDALTYIHKAPASAATALLPFLKDPEPGVRLKAAEALCATEEADKDCLPVLLELVGRRDSKIRQSAAVVLAQYGSAAKDAAPALIEALRNDPDPKTRIAAINALGAIGPDAKAALPALKAVEKDPQLSPAVSLAVQKIDQ